MPVLHLLNGDAQLELARQVFPNDLYLVQRECYSEGPARLTMLAADIEQRVQWLNKAYHLAETPRSYLKLHLHTQAQELVASQQPIDRVYLWFDPDLFCQVNQLYALVLLLMAQLVPKEGFYLTWHSAAEDLPRATHTAQDFETRLKQAYLLDPAELRFLTLTQQLIAAAGLPGLDLHRHKAKGALAFLDQVLRLHLSRLPGLDGLSETDRYLIAQAPGKTLPELSQLAAEGLADWGLGDLQINYQLHCLQQSGWLQLNDGVFEAGKNGQPYARWLGNYDWQPASRLRWNAELDKIVNV